jgi:hypothetical protein
LWENFEICFENKFDFIRAIQLDDDILLYILSRIDKKYLNKEEDNIIGNDLVLAKFKSSY